MFFEITPPQTTAIVWDTSALVIQCLLILFKDKAGMNKVSKLFSYENEYEHNMK